MRQILTLLGVILIAGGVMLGGWPLLVTWLGADFVFLGVAHGRGLHGLFGKRASGTLPLWSWCLFFPLLVFTLGVWHLVRVFSSESPTSTVTEQLIVGRRLLPSELQGQFANYVDLTAEFAEPAAIRESSCYVCFPILDAGAPTPDALLSAVSGLRPGRTFIHCAQGHGRTGLFAAAVLLKLGVANTAEEALRMLTAVRPGIRLNGEQRKCLNMCAERLRVAR